MDKQLHVIAGLPRSGSTLLANILAQNPRFEATAREGILDVIAGVIGEWDRHFAQPPDEQTKLDVVRGILDDYYGCSQRPVVFDRCRGWLASLEVLEAVLRRKATVLVTVRDLRDVLASLESLWRRTPTTLGSHERRFLVDFQSLDGRCQVWLRQDEVVGREYDRIQQALRKGFRDRLHFVRFEALTARPRETMQGVYGFLEEPWFEHDFEHVQQVMRAHDEAHGPPGLDDVRPRVAPVPPRHPRVLGALAEKFKAVYIWDQPQWA